MTNIKLLKVGETIPVNEDMAGLVPLALEAEQVALTEDIGRNGLREPVVLWKGEIVDGRCRQKACNLSGKPLMSRDLDDTLTEEEVSIFVKSVNTRRNLTATQKVIVAIREYIKTGSKSLSKTAKSNGISVATLKNAKYISENRPEFIYPLFNGKSVEIVNQHGQEVSSNKITAIYSYIKRESENISENEDHAWGEDTAIKTQVGKEWYYQQVNKEDNLSTQMKIHMTELANYKFAKKED